MPNELDGGEQSAKRRQIRYVFATMVLDSHWATFQVGHVIPPFREKGSAYHTP